MSRNDRNQPSVPTDALGRREILALSSAAAVTGLAGCGGGGDGDGDNTTESTDDPGGGGDDTTSDGGGGEQGETVLNAPTGSITSEDNMNPFTGQGWNYTMANFMFDKTMKSIQDGTIQNYIFEEFSMEDPTTEVHKLKEGFKWWNGDAVNAEDWGTQLNVARLQNASTSTYEEIEIVDDYTVKGHRKDPVNPSLRKQMMSGRDISAYRGKYDEWETKLKEATSDSERQQVAKNLTEHEVTYTDIMENGWCNGPYQLVEVQNQSLIYEPFDGHPWSDQVQLDTVRFDFSESNSAGRRQMIANDQYDLQTQTLFPSNLRSQAPDHLQNISEYGALWMWTLKTNWSNTDALKEVGVRRAMAAAMNLEFIKQANDGNGMPVATQTGMDPNFSQGWIGEDLQSQLHSYPTGEDYEAADSHLEGTDYSREGGQVVGPDGNQVQLKFIAQTGSPRNLVAQAASSQLKNYGFKVDFRALSRNQFVNTYYDDMGAWDLCVESHYGGSYFHPLAYYNIDHMFGMILTHYEQGQEQVKTWIDEGKEMSPYNGKPLTPEIPSQPGAMDLGDGAETVDLYESNVVLTQSQSEQETTEMVKKLARMWNYHLPDIDLIQRVNGAWGDTKNFDWPAMDAPSMNTYRGPFYAIKKGEVGYN